MIHVVKIATYSYADYTEDTVFYTEDEDTARKWCERYNKIVEDNRERLETYYDYEGYYKEELFMHDYIVYREPRAIYETVNEKR